MFVAIALVAVTGFAGVVPNFKFDKPEQVYADEITALGLEYKNGWYLIDSAMDYYAMQHCVNTGIGNTAKYKQVCNIDLADADNPYEGEIQEYSFCGIFNGGGYSVHTAEDTKPQMAIIESKDIESETIEETYTESADGIKQESAVDATAGWKYYGTNIGFGWLFAYIGLADMPGIVRNTDMFIKNTNVSYTDQTEGMSYDIGGLVGFTLGDWNVIEDCRVTFVEHVTVKLNVNAVITHWVDTNSLACGGILGSAHKPVTMRNCIVRDLNMTIDASTGVFLNIYLGWLAGWMGNASSSKYEDCFVISPVELKATYPDDNNYSIYWKSVADSVGWGTGELCTNCWSGTLEDFSVGCDAEKYFGSTPPLDSLAKIDEWREVEADGGFLTNYNTSFVLCEDINGGELIQSVFVEKWSVRVYCATKDGDAAVYSGYKTITAYTNQTMGSIIDKNSNALEFVGETWHFTALTFTASSSVYYGKGNTKLLTSSENPEGVWFSEFVDEGNKIAKMYAHYSKTSVTVTAYLNGGSLGAGIVLPDPTNSKPIASTTVNGWTYTKTIGATSVDGEVSNWIIAITKDTYAGATYGTFPSAAAPSGYILKGWYLDKDDLNSKVETATIISGKTSIYAVYEPQDVQLYANGGGFDDNLSNGWTKRTAERATKSIAPGAEIGALPSASEVTRTGYSFDGWYTSTPGGTKIDSTTKVVAGYLYNGSYFAHWTPISFTVKYEAGGGTGTAMSSTSHTYGDGTTLSACTYTREYHTFAGWGTFSGSGVMFSAGDLADKVIGSWYVEDGGTVTLYAQWTPDTCTLVFDTNLAGPQIIDGSAGVQQECTKYSGGTGSAKLVISAPYGTQYRNSYWPTATATGYSFSHWVYKTTGSSPSTNIPINADPVTMVPYWTANTYTITANANGGTISNLNGWTGTVGATTVTKRFVYNATFSFPEATKDYHTFASWNTASDGSGTTVTTSTTLESLNNAGALTIYAIWTKIEYTVQCNANGGAINEWATGWEGSGDIVTLKTELTVNDSGNFVISQDFYNYLPNIYLKRTGYTHHWWWIIPSHSDSETEAGKLKVNSEFAPRDLSIDGTTITFYAHWTPITYYIKYEKNAPSGVTVSGSMDNSEHTYDVERLLTANAYSATSYVFMGWSTTSDGAVEYEDKAKVKNLTAEDDAIVPLYAIWTEIYTINLYYNAGGDLSGGIAAGDKGYKLEEQDRGYPTYDYDDTTKNAVIQYIVGNEFYLPGKDENGKDKDHVGRRGYTFSHWFWEHGSEDAPWTHISATTATSLDLYAKWDENTYEVEFDCLCALYDGYTCASHYVENRDVKYTDTAQEFPKLNHTDAYKFVGWTATIYPKECYVGKDVNSGTLLYSELDENIQSGGLEGSNDKFEYSEDDGDWGDYGWGETGYDPWYWNIYKGDKGFEKLLHTGSVTFYAVWTPIYTVTINAGDSNAVVNGDGKATNDYYNGYWLQKELSVIGDNDGTADGVYWKYHDVDGWQVKVGGTQYVIDSSGKWVPTEVKTDLVNVGVNLQYLQGNIEITPDWDPFDFDVIFKTDGSEAYKKDYNDTIMTHVIYGSEYIFMSYPDYTKSKTFVVFTEIKGYSPIYACPYNSGAVDITNKLRMYGTWDYDLDYQHDGSGYYIEVEGYYLPNLYKLQFNINEPYGTPTTETPTSDIASTALNVIGPLTSIEEDDSETSANEAWTYIVNDDYNDKPGKLFKDASNNYYIYLLNDSEMTYNSTVKRSKTHYVTYSYDYDSNAHGFEDRSWTLPTWTIPYYEMQYFYIIKQNNVSEITMYQMAKVEDAHTAIAEEKIGGTEREINPGNWTYAYCNSNNANGGEGYTLNLYWYRKRINLEVSNLFDGAQSPNGYTVVQETEQIRLKPGSTEEYELEGHSPYHVVIYINDGVSNKYYIKAYSDEPTTEIKNKLFDGENISVEILEDNGWKEGNTVEIYFGNQFTLMARDQSIDHSLDDFIGYRFKEFTLDEIFQTPVKSGYSAYQNLQEIDKDTHQSGVTEYIVDRATYNVATNFEKISYTITYQISNEELTYTSKYGYIRLDGKDCNNNTVNISSSNPAEAKVTLQINGKMKSTMNVRLGSELLYWRSASKADSLESREDTDKDQIYNLELTPEFLRDHIYYATNDPYAVDDEELTIHAICKDILFDINVNVKDIETGKVVRTYTLSTETENLLFILEGGLTKVSIDQDYDIVMLSKGDGDSYVYYYQDIDEDGVNEQYAILKLYIEHSSSHSTEQLVKGFSYPADSLGSIDMTVDDNLLNYTINYSQSIEVKDVNRHLDFYIEVSPTIEIKFSDYIYDDNDAKIGARKLTIMGQEVASCSEDGDLEIKGSYLGYVGQTVTFNATADSTYYQGVRLLISPNYINMPLSADTSYEITKQCTVYVTFIPKTYTYSIDCEYNGILYENCREIDAATGEERWETITLADGTKIFYEINVADVAGNKGTTPNYYYGDKLEVTAKLSTEITGFELNVYKNGIKLTGNNGVYIATFTGDETTQILIEVIPQPENVVIKTNPGKEGVADVHVKVNNGEIKPLTEYASGIDLIDGDGLTVYVKSKLGYSFNNQYIKDDITTDLAVKESEDMPGYVEFQLFASYQATGVKGSKGTYFLQFNEVPIIAEFVYYSTTDGDVVDAGKNIAVAQISRDPSYTETQVGTFMPGAELKLINRVDNPGYRFLGYTYASPMGADGAVGLDSTFTILEAIYDYLSIDYPASITDGKVSFKIYVNYINQYKITVKTNNGSKTKIDFKTKIEEDEEPLSQNTYYDHGTLVIATLSTGRSNANDTQYYKFNVEINGVAITETSSGVADILKTNANSLSGFTLTQDLVENMVIDITVSPEKYYTKLQEHLEYSDKAEDKSSSLEGITELKLTNNVYYKVESEHYYDGEVKIYIYTAKPQNAGEWYYKLDKIQLNGVSHTVGQAVLEDVEGVEFYKYEITYTLNSDCIPEPTLDIYYKAYYYVEVNIVVNAGD